MTRPNISVADEYTARQQTQASAVPWGAMGTALSLILLILGIGLDLFSAYRGVSTTIFSVSAILGLNFGQRVAAGMEGYLAGRLRTKWVAVHTDEVYFRDTAQRSINGF